MEWYEHDHEHDHATHPAVWVETPTMQPRERLACRLANLIGMTGCCLTSSAEAAAAVAVQLLFSPELGERALLAGDEVMVVSPAGLRANAQIGACGGRAVVIDYPPDTCRVEGSKLEAALSLATRAVLVEHAPGNPINLLTVRNFCNKYDLWMIEHITHTVGSRYVVDGQDYAVGAIADWSYLDLCAVGIAGGAVLTRDALLTELAEKAVRAWHVEFPACDTISPITGCENLQRFPEKLARCRQNFDRLQALWQGCDRLCLPSAVSNAAPSHIATAVLCGRADWERVAETLTAQGVIAWHVGASQKCGNGVQNFEQNALFEDKCAFFLNLDCSCDCLERAAHAALKVLSYD